MEPVDEMLFFEMDIFGFTSHILRNVVKGKRRQCNSITFVCVCVTLLFCLVLFKIFAKQNDLDVYSVEKRLYESSYVCVCVAKTDNKKKQTIRNSKSSQNINRKYVQTI